MQTYADLIEQTFYYPTEEFKTKNNQLLFHDVDLMAIIRQYGTPLKISYLPKIGANIDKARHLFSEAFKKHNYQGDYVYCYCTKSSHFQFVLTEATSHGAHIETSSAFDIPIVRKMFERGEIAKDTFIICNGFKRPAYLENVTNLLKDGFSNCMPILDNLNELDHYLSGFQDPFQVGIRVAADEEPNFAFYTSRLGVRYNDIIPFYEQKIKESNAQLKMLHYFINTGIKDTAYYWSELSRFIYKYCELKKVCPELDSVDIGGGFPIKNSIHFEYDYAYMIDQIVQNIQWICHKNHVPTPNIFTEFGSYTVGESGATIYSVLDQKLQNDKELWYMMDGSFITHMPDVWGMNDKFILLPINHWDQVHHRVNIGGLTCDSMDYYDSEAHIAEVFLPQIPSGEKLFFGFFHTGAYQESLGGYGGIQHCLIPAPKHVLLREDDQGQISSELFAEEQSHESMLKILGY